MKKAFIGFIGFIVFVGFVEFIEFIDLTQRTQKTQVTQLTGIAFAGEKEELQLQRALLIEIIRRATFEAELAKRQLQEVETKIQAISQKEEPPAQRPEAGGKDKSKEK